MQYELKIKLLSEFLGEQRTTEGVRRFNRAPSVDGVDYDFIKINESRWHWAVTEAVANLAMTDVEPATIHFPPGYRAPSMFLFNRKWYDKQGTERREKHESVRKGCQLTLEFVTTQPEPCSDEVHNGGPPSTTQATEIFRFIGRNLGLSQFGNGMGFGRFDVMSLTNK